VSATQPRTDPPARIRVAVITFELHGRRFGLPAASVREIYPAVTITPLPGAPVSVEGVVDVRGTVAPVFDLRSRFGLPSRPQEPDDHLIIAQAADRVVVLRVDRALDLVQVPADQLQPAALPDVRLPHVAGVAQLPEGLVVICDLTAFLSSAESIQLAAALEAT